MIIPNPYIYKTPDVCLLLGVTRMTLYTWEKQGRFLAPRNTAGDRVFTEEQMKEIAKEFRPGGSGRWIFTQ
jgi:DNA-binding transcriptional MerR regulator